MWKRLWQAPVSPDDVGNVVPLPALAATQDGRTVYAASYTGYLWRSDNGGVRWHRSTGSLPADFGLITMLAVHPHNRSILYAACLGGLYETTNGGTSWHQLPVVRSSLARRHFDASISAVTIDPRTPTSIWAGKTADDGLGGLFHSQDGGRTWTWMRGTGLPFVASVRSIAVSPATSAIVYAEVSNGVYRSSDGG